VKTKEQIFLKLGRQSAGKNRIQSCIFGNVKNHLAACAEKGILNESTSSKISTIVVINYAVIHQVQGMSSQSFSLHKMGCC